MKKITFGWCLILLVSFAQAQNGLERIIVEKYYIANAADATAADADTTGLNYPTGSSLAVGAVTYRIYADMLPGYKFQAIYGLPTHTLVIATTTNFYNSVNGTPLATQPSITKANIKNKVVALDSWFSVGAACNGHFGIPKDDDGAAGGAINVTVVSNPDGVLLNTDAAMGTPLTTADGLWVATASVTGTVQAVTLVGITTEADVFGDGSVLGNKFITSTGSIASLNGSTGATSDNKVLIAQITTNGVLTFELNVQIGTPTFGTESYVASNPGVGEIQLPSLSYPLSNLGPVVAITNPTGASQIKHGDVVNFAATASDNDGVASVQFFVDNVSLGTDLTAPYAISYNAVNLTSGAISREFKVVATDSLGKTTTVKVVNGVSDSTTVFNQLPVINFTKPINDTTVILNDSIVFAATASDADDVVRKVIFYINGNSIDTVFVAPYNTKWKASLAGTYSLTASAQSQSIFGLQSTSTKTIKVTVEDTNNIAPVVIITSPVNDTTIKVGSSIVLAADASDMDNGIASVQFFKNGTALSTVDAVAPFQYTWFPLVSDLGTDTVTAVAIDSAGLKTTSTPIIITVTPSSNIAPIVTITSPVNGATFTPGNAVLIQATATDADGTIVSVDFWVNGAIVGSDAIAPYEYSWTSVSGTAVALTAVATDNNGGKDTSATVTISISVGINDIANFNASFQVYPNPTKESLSIEFISLVPNTKHIYTIYGINGNVVMRKEMGVVSGKYVETIDVTTFAKGQYIIELTMDGQVVSTKNIIKY